MTKSSDDLINGLISTKFSLVKENLVDDELHDYLTNKIKSIKKDKTKIITLVGGVASGKTTLAKNLVKRLGSADSITTDAFAAKDREYRHKQYGSVEKKYDLVLFHKKLSDLQNLKEGDSMKFPRYDEATGLAAAAGEEYFPKTVTKVDYFIIEGDFNFCENDEDLSIYLHVPDDVRIQNRIERDVKKRGWTDTKKLEHDIREREQKQHFPFTLPNAKYADILIVVKMASSKYTHSVYEKTKN